MAMVRSAVSHIPSKRSLSQAQARCNTLSRADGVIHGWLNAWRSCVVIAQPSDMRTGSGCAGAAVGRETRAKHARNRNREVLMMASETDEDYTAPAETIAHRYPCRCDSLIESA